MRRIHGITPTKFEQVIRESDSYSEAATILNVHIKTIISWAKKLGCQRTGHNGGGTKERFELSDILEGKHPQYSTYMLKNRLIKGGKIKEVCSECGIDSWNSNPISLELDHVDGDRHNHRIENLRLLCPNCHSQTPTYKSRNKKIKNDLRKS